MSRPFRRAALLAVAAMCLLAEWSLADSPAANRPLSRYMELQLIGGLFQGERPAATSPTLILDLVRNEQGWERVWGMARI